MGTGRVAYQKRDLNRAAAPLSREPACSRKLTGLWDGACYHPYDDLPGDPGRVDNPDRPLFAERQMVVISRRAHGTADGVSHRWALYLGCSGASVITAWMYLILPFSDRVLRPLSRPKYPSVWPSGRLVRRPQKAADDAVAKKPGR